MSAFDQHKVTHEGTAPSALDDPTGMLPWSSSVSKCMLKHAAN